MATGSLPDVAVVFRPEGVKEVISAFKTVEQASEQAARRKSAEAIKAERIATGIAKAEADAKVREFKRGQQEIEREMARSSQRLDAFGNRIGANDRGLRQISSSRAFEQVFGQATARLIGLQGPMGQISALAGVASRGLDLLGTALQQFGGYVLSSLKALSQESINAKQIANRVGNGVTGAQVQGTIASIYRNNPLVDRKTAAAVAEQAFTITKDVNKAKTVTDLSMQGSNAYGADPVAMAKIVGAKRMSYAGMSEQDFRTMMSAQLATAGKLGSVSPDEWSKNMGKIDNMATKFAITKPGGGTNYEAMAARDNELSTLMVKATNKGMSASAATGGMESLLNDLSKNKIGTYAGTGTLKPLQEILPQLIAATGGDLSKLGAGAKSGMTVGGQSLGGGFSDKSIDFLRSLDIDKVVSGAGGGKAGEAAAAKDLAEQFEKARDASALATDAKKVEEDSGYRVEAAFRKLESKVLDSLAPVLEEQGPKIADAISEIVAGLADVDLVGTFKAIVTAIGALLYGVMDMLPDSMQKSMGGDKTKGALAKLAGIDEQSGGATKTGLLETAADQSAHPERYWSGLTGFAAGLTKYGTVDPRDMQKLGGVGATKNMGSMFADAMSIPASEGGMPMVQGPPRADKAVDAAAQKMSAAADKLSSAADKLAVNDPSKNVPLAGIVGVK